jgi:signal transduction histidine kinase
MMNPVLKLFPGAKPHKPDPLAQKITAQAIDILYRSMFRTGVMLALMPVTTAWIMWAHIDHGLLLGWCAIAYSIAAARLLVTRAYFRRSPPEEEAQRWGRYFTYIAWGNGIVWGAASLLFFVPDSAALQVYLLIVVITMSVASVFLHAYWIESYYAFNIPIFSLLVVNLMQADDTAYTGLLIGLLAIAFTFLHMAQNTRQATMDSIRLRFENLDLVEQLRTEKEKAETASRDKTRFLASASHDLRQPVHALTLFTHALRQELKDGKATALLDDMGRSIDALNQLLGSLLDISKLDADIVKPNIEHFYLDDLAQVLNTEYTPQAQAKGLSFRVNADDDLIVCSDRALLETMLRNLISNALRYTNAGGVEVEFKSRGDEVHATVRDTGIGIAPEQQENIFREFYQVSNPERDRSMGLGLGLAIVKRLAILLHHRIDLVSDVGKGSSFKIILPAGERSAMAALETQQAYLAKRDIDGMRVLVIDDEVAIREGMQAVLAGWGCEVTLAGSENEALEKMQNGEPPHAIIADYRLREGKNGVQAIDSLRAEFGSAIPALIITGDTDPERLREAQASGNALMHKPVQPAKLRAYLRSVQRRKA